MNILLQLLIGFLLAVVIALVAWKAGALSVSGALAAVLTGGLIFGLGGLAWAAILLTFFISSSLLTKAFSKRKAGLAEKFSKGSRRDWAQVLANGGLGALLVVVYAFPPHLTVWWVVFAGAMAAVNADTWSTELGVLSPAPPRMITTGKKVERGTSGGITLAGILAALGGATLIGIVAALVSTREYGESLGFSFLIVIISAGLVGSLFDSLLGATIQAIYWCPTCSKETERHPLHTCGTPTEQIRGVSWINNDVVNFACSVIGALFTLWLIMLLLVISLR